MRRAVALLAMLLLLSSLAPGTTLRLMLYYDSKKAGEVLVLVQ